MQSIKNTLWSYGISGDNPIILVKISEVNNINVVKDLLKAFRVFINKNIFHFWYYSYIHFSSFLLISDL